MCMEGRSNGTGQLRSGLLWQKLIICNAVNGIWIWGQCRPMPPLTFRTLLTTSFHQKNYCNHNYSLGLLQVTKSQLIICDYYLFRIFQGVMELVFNLVPIQGNTSLKLLCSVWKKQFQFQQGLWEFSHYGK